MLDDTAETGRVYKIENGWLEFTSPEGHGLSNRLPDSLTDPKLLRGEPRESVRDRIATKVAEALAGALRVPPAAHGQ